jgi:hypothetical protein
MKNLLRSAAIAVASTALVAGGATAATAAPTATATTTSVAASSSDVTVAAAPYGLDYKSKLRATKRGSKIKFRFTARFRDDAGNPVGIRKVTLKIKRGGKWRTLKNVKLKSNGTGSYNYTKKKRYNYKMVIKPTALYQGGETRPFKI